MRPRLVVLVSGNGSNLQAIIDARSEGRLQVDITGVVSNNADAFALTRAEKANIATSVLSHKGRERSEYDSELAHLVSVIGADLVVLAGWNRLLTANFVSHHTTINLHPAEPGRFPGLHAIERAYKAYKNGELAAGGVMVHYVPDEGIDDGPVIDWSPVPFSIDDTLETFEQRVHEVEHELLVNSINVALGNLPLKE